MFVRKVLFLKNFMNRTIKSIRILLTSVAAFLSLHPLTVNAEDILIAVAANFAEPMEQIIAEFEEGSVHNVEMSIGSSGRFYAQIVNGAPYQIFFSADQEKIEQLAQAGLTVEETAFTYAVGRLALWSAEEELPITDLNELDSSDFDRLAIANPRLAPYGVASVEVLKALELFDSFQEKLVQGENIAQAFQFIDTGNADLGFVALSQVFREEMFSKGQGIFIPEEFHTPIRQDAALLRSGQDCDACVEFLEFMRSQEARSILHSFGYQ